MRYNYKDIILPVLEFDFYERCSWNNLCKTSIKSKFLMHLGVSFKVDSFLRLPEVSGFNDVNLIKSFYFLFTLFYGFNFDFKLHYLKKSKVINSKHSSDAFVGYFSNLENSRYKFFLQLSFLMFFLFPYLKSKQSEFKFVAGEKKIIFALSDLSNLVTGAGSLSLYYDYFDWDSVILSFEFFPLQRASINCENSYNIFRLL